MTREEIKQKALELLAAAGTVLSEGEIAELELVDFGFDRIETEGLAIVVYINNARYCAKELVLLPRQTCAEHRHPPVGEDPGKMETFRCRSGRVYLYVEGKATEAIGARVPKESETYYTVFHEVILNPGEQYTIAPNTLHWFQAGDEGAVVSEFSSTSRDETDVFTDPRIRRVPDAV